MGTFWPLVVCRVGFFAVALLVTSSWPEGPSTSVCSTWPSLKSVSAGAVSPSGMGTMWYFRILISSA